MHVGRGLQQDQLVWPGRFLEVARQRRHIREAAEATGGDVLFGGAGMFGAIPEDDDLVRDLAGRAVDLGVLLAVVAAEIRNAVALVCSILLCFVLDFVEMKELESSLDQ